MALPLAHGGPFSFRMLLAGAMEWWRTVITQNGEARARRSVAKQLRELPDEILKDIGLMGRDLKRPRSGRL
jgi:uncharacterized protein YjiS (DUF1127 family)